jgi:hypothetical protein
MRDTVALTQTLGITLECLLQKVRSFQRFLRSLRTLEFSAESCPESEQVRSLRYFVRSFGMKGYKYPLIPFILSLLDLTSPAFIPEHSLLHSPIDFQARFGEGIEGK